MLAPLLEGKRELAVPGAGMQVAHPGFRFFATQNPAKDAGRFKLPPALRTRFVKVCVADFSEADLCTVIRRRIDDSPAGIPLATVPVIPGDASLLSKAYYKLPAASSDVK